MKRIILNSCVLILFAVMFVACSNEDNNEEDSTSSQGENQESTTEGTNNSKPANTDEAESSQGEDASDNTEEEADTSGEAIEEAEDQLELGIGDTGKIVNNFSTHEITLNSVEITEEAGGEPTQEGNYVIVNLTIKNLGDDVLNPEDALSSTELATEPGAGGLPWFYIDGVAEEWPAEIAPGESVNGVLLFDIEQSDEYALQTAFDLDSLSNQVSFVFNADEAN
ncbi:DUF4352 domain-containing protein [Oceanobacillus kapialis]|uniref:DUF4352 domain-containing protein n=1 Tax=Oceanobacillus kapialis TaxID=481353 RepID=A0ABW5Q5X0_9BACI